MSCVKLSKSKILDGAKEHNSLSLVLSYYGGTFVGLPYEAGGLSQNIVTSPQEEGIPVTLYNVVRRAKSAV